jgi:hypothetical protein
MTIREAGQIEIETMSVYIVPPFIAEECNVCHNNDELRAGVCYSCSFKCETDMKEVWERDNVFHRWPYVWSAGHSAVKKLMGIIYLTPEDQRNEHLE